MPPPRVPYSSTILVACPIDGLPVRTTRPDMVGDVTIDAAVGGHVHLIFDTIEGTCPQGHRWSLLGDVILERGPDQ